MFAVSFLQKLRDNGAVLVYVVPFYKGWDIDLIVASLYLLFYFTEVGI